MKIKYLLLFVLFSVANAGAQKTNIPTSQIKCRDPFITVDRQNGEYYLILSARGPENARLFAY